MKTVQGTVVSVAKQWWLKINTKSFRTHALDGATFPHVIKVKYTVNGKEYTKRKWISAGKATPKLGESVLVSYNEAKPSKAKICEFIKR
jgi:hypothetical protein